MKLLKLKQKVNKGINLGAEIVYIKEKNNLFGIENILKNNDKKSIVFTKSKGESLMIKDFVKIIDKIYDQLGDIEVCVGKKQCFKEEYKSIGFVEFAQYENIKMLFLNI